LFGSCLYDKFACGVWSDPGIVFDEARSNVNYWEPWYLGLDDGPKRKPGIVTPENPRTGPYATLMSEKLDLHELHALMAPRPFLVSGGAEDRAERWVPLNRSIEVCNFLGVANRVAMTNRPSHAPTDESNAQIVAFFERCLKSPPREVVSIAHRGLLHDTPENTVPNFAACLDVGIGIEFDVSRTRDGMLVCLHDETLDRTTDGSGPVTETTLADVQQLDAGGWFAPQFKGLKVPTIDEVLALIAAHPTSQGVYAVDLKAKDKDVEADVMQLAKKHGVLDRLLFIGRTIDNPNVRKRLRAADKTCHSAVLAQTRDDLSAAIADVDSDWVYVRFVPTADDVAAIRAAGKRTMVSGSTVAGRETENWRNAIAAGADAILTDYPIELRRTAATLEK
jgi:glycerophosphoryl diester phosphodiesterase